MNINGRNNITSFNFKHRGLDMNFSYHAMPVRYNDSMSGYIKPTGIATFEFDDITEVTQLIRMLEEYREGLAATMGVWKRERVNQPCVTCIHNEREGGSASCVNCCHQTGDPIHFYNHYRAKEY